MNKAVITTQRLLQKLEGENADEQTKNRKKLEIIEKVKFLIKQDLNETITTELYQESLNALQCTDVSLEDLVQSLEDGPFKSSLKRAIGLNILREAIKDCEVRKPDRIMTLLTWFQRAMRYTDL